MNLQRLYIQNYKQFREPVELLPPEGAVGVVGSNGTGKSTLFESILWAFFGSRGGGPRFSNESIPWSGGSTKDPSVVEVTLATGGGSYTVRRQLKSGSTSAEALDEGGKTIVSGSADVGRWVEESLLHMDRTAFEATFYARQKELEFFANDDGISRVRRISRMLGISSVEAAQKLLRDDRNDLRAEARMIEGRLAEADLEGLQNELEEARTTCRRLETELEKVSGEYEEAQEKLGTAREERSKLDAAYREHSRLTADLQRADGEKHRAEDRAAEAEKDLEELAAAAEELERIKPEVSPPPGVRAGVGASGRGPAQDRAARPGPQGEAPGPGPRRPPSSRKSSAPWRSSTVGRTSRCRAGGRSSTWTVPSFWMRPQWCSGKPPESWRGPRRTTRNCGGSRRSTRRCGKLVRKKPGPKSATRRPKERSSVSRRRSRRSPAAKTSKMKKVSCGGKRRR